MFASKKSQQSSSEKVSQQQSPTCMRYARLLLQLYHTDGQQNKATIDQFIANYSQNIQIPVQYRPKLQQQLQIGEYNHLKNSLNSLTQEYQSNLHKLQQLNSNRYKPIKEIIAQKHHASLDNLQIRLAAIKPAAEDDQQLGRVKKLIENGLWGCLARLNDRLAKLTTLEQDK